MADALFSPLWYRVAEQTPRLRSDVLVRRQSSRGQLWYVLVCASSARQCRINRSAYQFVGCCDGRLTVQRIWDTLLQDLRDAAPTQDEVIQILARLSGLGMLEYAHQAEIASQSEQRARNKARQRRANLNPLAFRVPLGDPSALLRRFDGLRRALFHPATGWLWLALVMVALAAAAGNWDLLRTHAALSMVTPHHLFLAWVLFPFIKALHELAHALAVRHWGGEVHGAGISLFVLTPAPYVDASASAGFRRRYQRAGVAAMGVLVELALAALALLLWLNVQDGLVRDLAFVTLFVCSVSTLLYNANPLLTFDGYYVLCDALDLPNLSTRSRRYWVQLLQQVVFGAQAVVPIDLAKGERKWLSLYAPLSAAYRVVLSGWIVLWVGHYSMLLGVLLAAYVALAVLLLPVWRLLRSVLAARSQARTGWRWRAALSAGAALALALLFVLPLPFHTTAWGVVWLPELARARAQTEGFVSSFAAREGERVRRGDLLLTLQDPLLLVQREKLSSELRQLGAERFEALAHDSLKALNLQQDIERVQGDLARVQQRIEQLEVRAQTDGMLVSPNQQDLVGSFVRRGTTLGYVLNRDEVRVRAAVPERDAALIRESQVGAEVRLAESMGETLKASLVRDVPAAGFELPGAALGDRAGGPYLTDPADKDGLRSVEPVVLIDLFVPQRRLQQVGGRVWVRFDHGAQPLAQQGYRRLRQLFLQHFDAAG